LGQKLFNQGDFDAALRALDAAVLEGGDPGLLEKVHVLRAQCFAARQDFVRAEEAFGLALDANPDVSLDPARVDPTVVKLLEAVRQRLVGSVFLGSTPAGALLELDGKPAGRAPLSLQVSAGTHKVAARWDDGTLKDVEIQVRPRREVRVEWVELAHPAPSVPKNVSPLDRPVRPFGDLRGVLEIPSNQGAHVTGGIDLGGGFEFSVLRVALYARLFPNFGVVPRFSFVLPVLDRVSAKLELAVPVQFISPSIGLGVSGTGGAEYYPLDWIGIHLAIGGRHYFLWPNRNDPTAFIAEGGVRLRLP
jgi:hypothetical protein